ncbi:pulmonary surfactant-associated protein D-like [Sphaerodactylus townsendi]|uniref:pulmonary surfactant-associated protein D-like n=1 Tax=Sphaerodactylus townsendi TaxID=933632 RepID=UPI00202661BB|nr:pulmonary surfactant-associated protein D-like [Sphaerodactylus townsendi]
MLVLLTFCTFVSQAASATDPMPPHQVMQNLDRNACSLVICGPAEKGLPGRDGREGIQGPKGDMGAQGIPGPRGIVGPPGKTGPTGLPGEKGSQGVQGEKGDLGNMGKSSITAMRGTPMTSAPSGTKGDIGPQGEKGATGDKGPMGAIGAQGPKGTTGNPGPKGDQGSVGEKGDKGEVGGRGLQGPTGMPGPMGRTGSSGLKGDKGSIGEKGMKGDSGLSESNLMKNQVSALQGQLAVLQATLAKYQKVAAFPSGRIVGNRAFVTSGYEGNFDDLRQRCLQAGGQLASPRNAAENAAIQQIVILHNKPVFLGINDIQTEGRFKYLNGETIAYSNWQQGEPNNEKGRENCVEIFVNGRWNDRSCGEKRLIVCEF